MGGVVFLLCWFFGMRHPNTGAYRLLGRTRSWCWWSKQDVCLLESSTSWTLPEISTISVHVPRESDSHTMLPQETLWNQQVGLAQVPKKSLTLLCVPVCMRPCVFPPRVKFSFPPSPMELLNRSLVGLQSQMLGGFFLWCQIPGLRSLMWGLKLSLLWENFCNIIILQFVDCPTTGYGIWLHHKCAPLTLLLWFLLYVLRCRISFQAGSSLFYRWLFSI